MKKLLRHVTNRMGFRSITDDIFFFLLFAILAFAYFLIAKLSLVFAISPGVVSALWPPSAIALSACLVWGLRMVPAIYLAAIAVYWSAGLSVYTASVIGAGNSLEVIIAVMLMRRMFSSSPYFSHFEDIFKFVGIALASSFISASIGVASLVSSHSLQTSQVIINWLTWWLGNSSGMIILTPLALSWNIKHSEKWAATRIMEAILLGALTLSTTQIAFGDVFGHWALAYLPIPFVIWAAFRFPLSGVMLTIGLIYAIAILNTINGYGPFSTDNVNASLLLLIIYISILATLGITISSLLHERQRTKEELTNERDELERHVQDRTRALSRELDERHRIEQILSTREHQLREAQHIAQIGSWNWDIDSDTVTWSDELYRICGTDKKHFSPTFNAYIGLIHPDHRSMAMKVIENSFQTGASFNVQYKIVALSGAIKTVEARGFVSRKASGKIVRMFGTLQDITETKQAEAALREAEERYRMVVELSPDAILIQQHERFVFANHAALVFAKATSMKQIVGKSICTFLSSDLQKILRERTAHPQRDEKAAPIEGKFIRLDGSIVDVDINSAPFTYHGHGATLFVIRDITERKKSNEQLAYLAHYDSLTGLPNRSLFNQRLGHALTLAQRLQQSLEILFIDLDRFKEINDTLGHGIGDLVLKEAADRLQGTIREADTVARLGGDEFIIMLETVAEPYRGGVIAEKILTALHSPFMRDYHPLMINASIGISSFPSDGGDAKTLLEKADTAMYQAKQSGGGSYRYYCPEMNAHEDERSTLEYALRHAIEKHQLSLHYQPKVDVLSQKIMGMEALLRWQHPTLGAVPPQQFIPIAEETGLIDVIGHWAIRTACMQNKRWQESGLGQMKVAVNLAAKQLCDTKLAPCLRGILDESGLDAGYLELEIAENAVMANPDQAVEVLAMLHGMGISIAIDDFGVGYSSLTHLTRFRVDAVKIDRSFVRGIPEDSDDKRIICTIIDLAHSLKCRVIAKGAETKQQFDFLRVHACDSVQGYYFSAPVNAERFEELLRTTALTH